MRSLLLYSNGGIIRFFFPSPVNSNRPNQQGATDMANTANCDAERFERLSELLPDIPSTTRYRWRTIGVCGDKIKAFRRGGIWMATRSEVERFYFATQGTGR